MRTRPNRRCASQRRDGGERRSRRGRGGGRRERARARTRTTTTTRAEKTSAEREIDEVTKKWGLEAGLWRVFKSETSSEGATEEGEVGVSRMDMAKKLLKRYGSAYLLTSISLSLVSITVFYFLVAGGVDVGALLEKVGITVNATSEQFGTFALAYAAHKGSSPIGSGPRWRSRRSWPSGWGKRRTTTTTTTTEGRTREGRTTARMTARRTRETRSSVRFFLFLFCIMTSKNHIINRVALRGSADVDARAAIDRRLERTRE